MSATVVIIVLLIVVLSVATIGWLVYRYPGESLKRGRPSPAPTQVHAPPRPKPPRLTDEMFNPYANDRPRQGFTSTPSQQSVPVSPQAPDGVPQPAQGARPESVQSPHTGSFERPGYGSSPPSRGDGEWSDWGVDEGIRHRLKRAADRLRGRR
jgi:hypothetical protein